MQMRFVPRPVVPDIYGVIQGPTSGINSQDAFLFLMAYTNQRVENKGLRAESVATHKKAEVSGMGAG